MDLMRVPILWLAPDKSISTDRYKAEPCCEVLINNGDYNNNPLGWRKFYALIDTGADMNAVGDNVINGLGAESTGSGNFQGNFDRLVGSPMYKLALRFPNSRAIIGTEFGRFEVPHETPAPFDIILGRLVLGHCPPLPGRANQG